MSWDEAQASFSRMDSPIPFLDASVCDDILADLRQPDGTLPDFGSIPSQPSSPPPHLVVACYNQSTQCDTPLFRHVGTQALRRPHQGTTASQTSPASSADMSTQVLNRPLDPSPTRRQLDQRPQSRPPSPRQPGQRFVMPVPT